MLKFKELCVNLHPNCLKMRKIASICMLLALLATMTSCLKGKNDTVTLYSDAAINGFTLGTLNRYVHTISSTGEDSVYKVTVTGSDYTFHIDQVNHRIYNTDSLPVGTDVAHVVCSITSANNGTITIKDIESDTLRYYSSADSIDFTQPRKFYIFSSDGEGETIYTISVNVHQQEGNEFIWELAGNDYEPAVGGEPTLPAGIKMLIGKGEYEEYAMSDDNRLMVSRDGGVSWQEELLDDDASLLPVQDIALIHYPMYLAENTDYVILVGNRSISEYPQEDIAMVWRKIVDKDKTTGHWTYMERTDGNRFALPRLENLTIVAYDDGILAMGGKGIGGCDKEPYSQIYQSRDNGITWKYNAVYQIPAGFDTSATDVDAVVDKEHYLWLYCTGSKQVWRGRLNRLGWLEK